VVTSYHVIQQAEEVEVILDDGRELKATVWGVDPKTDLALLKLDTDEALPFLEFGDSGSARTGDWVVAIGNPFGLGGTVTTGIISARGRDIRSGPYDDYLQIDAPINRGNSGGPLFDARGRVIGVNTAIYSPNGGNVGIGFAVPATQARAVVDELLENRSVTRGWLGVQIQSLDRELAEALGLEKTGGALVAQVMPDSPAESAGVRVGDVILAFDGVATEDARHLPHQVAAARPDRETAMEIWRDGDRQRLKVRPGRLPGDQASAPEATPAVDGSRLGVTVAALDAGQRSRLTLDETVSGVLVVAVEPDSDAARRGLRSGDVIVRADRQPVGEPEALAEIVREAASQQREELLLLVNRRGSQRFVTVRLG
jgi:serine protease Do